MTLFWSILTAIVFGYFFKSTLAFFIGLFAGPAIFRFFYNLIVSQGSKNNPDLFLTVAFEVLGHLSKAKGIITQNDIELATKFMDQLQLDSQKRKIAQASFNYGKTAEYPLRQRLRELYVQYRFRKNVLDIFCEQLIQLAMSDGAIDSKEEQILYIVAEEFNIPRAKMALYIQMMMASYHFRSQGFQQNRYQYYQQNSGEQHQYQQGYNHYQRQTSSANDLQNAYRVLGVEPTAEVAVIKRAYRKLMNEHHPDKLMSKGLPKEMLESAKKRAQDIQSAYDLIKSSRGFK